MAQKERRYCVKCKRTFLEDEMNDIWRCPRCDHKITFKEAFNYRFFGTIGAHSGCGCWVVIIIAIIIAVMYFKG